jgi:hypothetical protein
MGNAEHEPATKVDSKPLFTCGEVHIPPSVQSFLAAHGYLPGALMEPHCHGHFGSLQPGEAEANAQALITGDQLVSRPVLAGRRFLIITLRVSEGGVRMTTVLLFEDELHNC